MSNFGRSDGKTRICTADRTSITVRDKDLCSELIGHMSFAQYFHFLVTGEELTINQGKMLDALLISIAEHGLAPSVLAARMTIAAEPEALQGAVAAGILGCGSVVLGSSGDCADMLQAAVDRQVNEKLGEAVCAREIAEQVYADGGKLPGFGHPLHKPDDPRSVRLLEIADELGISGRYVSMMRAIAAVADDVWGKHLVLNVQAPIAAISLDMGLPSFMAKSIPLIARAVGILGHIQEERESPIGFHVTMMANDKIEYVP